MEQQIEKQLSIRAARPEDRTPVLAFCVSTFPSGDYIPDVWDEWLADPNGQLMVAALDGLPVGLQHVSFPGPDQAWLQGLRVDPAVRRRGVATALFAHAMEIVRQHGARVVRLLTKEDNAPVHHMMEVAGFEPSAVFTDLRVPADPSQSPPETAVVGEADDLWRLVADSEGFAATRGTYPWDWRWLELTSRLLAGHVERGQVFVLRRDGRAAAMALTDWMASDDSLWVGTLAGDPPALERLATQLRGRAGDLGLAEVQVYVPRIESLVAPLQAAGYGPAADHHIPDMELFAKDLSTP